jgi:alcohol dehydrogenase YqhD (iron-dependent ADH family)
MRIDRVLATDGGDAVDRAAAVRAAPTNAHLKRDPFDARVVAVGDPAVSGPFDRVVPLSAPDAGSEANRIVTDLSSDSGKGPWWRRPMAFDAAATGRLLARIDAVRG